MHTDIILLTNVASPIWQRSIGAYQIANHVRQAGYTAQVIDFIDIFGIVELQDIIESFITDKTKAIGISTTFLHSKTNKRGYINTGRYHGDGVMSGTMREMLFAIKAKYPHIKFLAGGSKSYQCVGDDLFDVVFHGYSEASVVEWLNKKRIYPKIGAQTIIDGSSSSFDIATLNHIWHERDCILPSETLPIEISRGCIFKCKFCSYPLNGKKKLDYIRQAIMIRDELIDNYNRFGTTNYYFADDTFNDSTEKLQILHDMIVELPFKIKFVTYLRLDLLHAHPEQIGMLLRMGLGSAFFGIETFNHDSGKRIGKGMNPASTKQFLRELYDVYWNEQIPITCSFIAGLPGESAESMRETRLWFTEQPFNDVWFPLTISPDSYYQSEFDKHYKDYGYILDENNNWTSDIMTQATALKLANEFNNIGAYHESTPSTWFLFSLLSYGFTIPELQQTKIKDLHYPQLALKKVYMLKEYKLMLLQVLNNSNSSSTTETKTSFHLN